MKKIKRFIPALVIFLVMAFIYWLSGEPIIRSKPLAVYFSLMAIITGIVYFASWLSEMEGR